MKLLPRGAMARHALAAGTALWAMWILVRYRVLGWSVVAYLPWLGAALVLLNVLFLVHRLIGPPSGDGSLRDTAARLDRAARLVVALFVYVAIFVALNGALDRTPWIPVRAEIVEIGGRTVSVGVPLIYSWADLHAVDGSGGVGRIVLGPAEQRKFWRGETVLLAVGSGRFGMRWIASIERDEEAYLRSAGMLARDAVQPWKDLVQFLFDHGRWPEAAVESRRYMAAHPDDADFAYWAGENLDLRGLEDDGTPLLERAVALRPSQYYSYRLAWALTRHGDSARAIDILTAASHRYPDAWEFPFLLGYHYARTGRYVEAIAALERVETLRPGVPDVDRVLAQLRQRARPALP